MPLPLKCLQREEGDIVLSMERQQQSGAEALDYIYDECCENCPQVLDLWLRDARS